MKKIIIVIASCIFLFTGSEAQDHQMHNENISSSYCAILKDGKMMLMAEGKQVNNEVTFANGTIVKTDGTIQKIDKTTISLKNGDCIDQDGNIIPSGKKRSDSNDKVKEEDKDKKQNK